MSKILIVLVALFAISQAGSFRNTVSDLELLVSSNGQVALTYVPFAGYVLPVDLSRNARVASNFIISLYSSKTLFAGSCFNFKSYPCSKQYDFCRLENNIPVTEAYPTFMAQGVSVRTQAYADYSAWALSAAAPTIFATNCLSSMTEAFGANTAGILGLGFEGAAQGNFMNMVSSFAVFHNQGFKLAFNPQLNFNKNVIAKVRTDANWRVPNIQAFKFAQLKNPLTGTSLIWDINSDAIGLPVPLYTAFIGVLQNYGVQCPSIYTTPICNYNGQTQFLPNIEFVVDAQTTIIVTPQMYALTPGNGKFTLNLKGTSPQMTGVNYVTAPYQYTIILGSSVVGGYYTYFNTNDRSVSLIQVL